MDTETASFTVEGGQDPVAKFSRVMSALNPAAEDLEVATKYLAEKTRSQSLSGFDVNNRPFHPYSALYAKRKGSTNVDLFSKRNEEHMLDAVHGRNTLDPPSVEVGIFDDPELAKRAAVHNEGLSVTGRAARTYIKSLRSFSHQKIAGLRRRLRNTGSITVIPKREWLGVTRQDLKIMSELIGQSIMNRLKGGS